MCVCLYIYIYIYIYIYAHVNLHIHIDIYYTYHTHTHYTYARAYMQGNTIIHLLAPKYARMQTHTCALESGHACIQARTYTHTSMFTWMHALHAYTEYLHIHVAMPHTIVCAQTAAHRHTYIYTCMRTRVQLYTYICVCDMHIYMHVHTCTSIYTCMRL